MNCYCPIGYQPLIPTNDNGTECEACQYGWYKNIIGPSSCLQCPLAYSVCLQQIFMSTHQNIHIHLCASLTQSIYVYVLQDCTEATLPMTCGISDECVNTTITISFTSKSDLTIFTPYCINEHCQSPRGQPGDIVRCSSYDTFTNDCVSGTCEISKCTIGVGDRCNATTRQHCSLSTPYCVNSSCTATSQLGYPCTVETADDCNSNMGLTCDLEATVPTCRYMDYWYESCWDQSSPNCLSGSHCVGHSGRCEPRTTDVWCNTSTDCINSTASTTIPLYCINAQCELTRGQLGDYVSCSNASSSQQQQLSDDCLVGICESGQCIIPIGGSCTYSTRQFCGASHPYCVNNFCSRGRGGDNCVSTTDCASNECLNGTCLGWIDDSCQTSTECSSLTPYYCINNKCQSPILVGGACNLSTSLFCSPSSPYCVNGSCSLQPGHGGSKCITNIDCNSVECKMTNHQCLYYPGEVCELTSECTSLAPYCVGRISNSNHSSSVCSIEAGLVGDLCFHDTDCSNNTVCGSIVNSTTMIRHCVLVDGMDCTNEQQCQNHYCNGPPNGIQYCNNHGGAVGDQCTNGSYQCATQWCNMLQLPYVCTATSYEDGILSGNETDIDCGNLHSFIYVVWSLDISDR
jgi:hypothetical protein